jgi:Mlc titration factor MtfA (ptsG expression regulator)
MAVFVENVTVKATVIGFCVLPIMLLVMFKDQLDWWYYKRNPQMLHSKMRVIVERFMPYFSNLLGDSRIRFEQRMSLLMFSKTYEKKGMDVVPEDLKGWIAANITKLTYGLNKYIFPKFEIIVIYPQKFSSFKIKEFHTSEVFEDGSFGGVIFALDHVMSSLQNPNEYNIIIHEYTNALWKLNDWSEKDFLEYATPQNLQILAKIRGLSLIQIQKYLGKPTLNFFAVVIEHFFNNPKALKEYLPDLYKEISLKLNQDPTNESNPLKFDVIIEEKK